MLETPFIPKSSETSSPISEISAPVPGVQARVGEEVFDPELRVSAEVATYLTNARLLIKHGEISLALNLLRQASNRDSKNPVTLDLLAECLERKMNFNEALVARRAAVQVDYGFETMFKFANVLYKKGSDDEALEKYFEALALLTGESAHLFELYKNMGNIFVRRGDFEGAEEYYNKAYTMDPHSDVLLVNLGTLEVQRGDYGKSLYCFRQAIEVNGDNDKAWVGLAMVHNHFGDVELAWANLETALDVNPRNRTAVHLLANWAARDLQWQKGISALENYLAAVEQDEEMSLVLLNLYCSRGDLDKARVEVEKVLLWNPAHHEVRDLRKKLSGMRAA